MGCADTDLLTWLLHPLQRAEDIAVALGVHPTTVFRHLQRLEQAGLVASVAPGTISNSGRLYYLTQAGLRRVVTQPEVAPQVMAEAENADEATLLHMLPRLSTWLVVQQVVTSLVREAPDRLSDPTGRRAHLTWRWRHEWQHTAQSKNRQVRCMADAALVFARRAPADGADEYYPLFLLADGCLVGSNDRLIIQRHLEQWLRYRESAERISVYRQFPPLVVLVPTPQQQERWQRLAQEVATQLRLAPLRGVIACVPPDQPLASAWALPWQGLSQPVPCHLEEALVPMSLEAVPPGMLTTPPNGTSRRARSRQLRVRGHYAERNRGTPGGPRDLAWLGIHLSHRQQALLTLLYAAPLLATEELAACAAFSVPTAGRALSALERLGCLEQEATGRGKRWRLTPLGLRFMAALLRVSLRHVAVSVGGTLQQRGLAELRRTIHHTAGVYGFLAAFQCAAQAAGQRIA